MKLDHSQPLEYSTKQNKLNILGFWIFLGAEIMLFATLFTTYFVLENRTGNGPTGAEIFEITPVLIETFVLLTSSFIIGLGIHAMRIGNKKAMMAFFAITLLLGLVFLGFEIDEFVTYIHDRSSTSNKCIYSDPINNIRNTWSTRNIWSILGNIYHPASEKTWIDS